MARTIDEAAHARRRNAFLDIAQRLIVTKGYHQMTIQDVYEGAGTSKGALYHYFGSKQALLEGLVDRFVLGAETRLLPCVNDPSLRALDKLQRFFALANQFKVERKQFLIAVLRVWRSDDNAIVRQKIHARQVERVEPLLTRMIAQGVAEGTFTTPFGDWVARVAIGIFKDLNDTLSDLVLAPVAGHIDRRAVERAIAAYTDALERVLGAPTGSMVLVASEQLAEWFETLSHVHEPQDDCTSERDTTWQKALV